MENERHTTTQEVDTEGGWLITHHTITGDTRVPLTQIDTKLEEAQADLVKAQARVDQIAASKVELAQEIADAKAREAEELKKTQDAREALLSP